MAKKRTRGGYRKPQNPAAVSGPGALSKSTDGKQPVVRVPDVPYGEQAALTAQQQAAPLPQQRPIPIPRTPTPQLNVFGTTERPAEPITEGAMLGAGSPPAQAIEEDENMLLAAMYAIAPSSLISEMINQGSI